LFNQAGTWFVHNYRHGSETFDVASVLATASRRAVLLEKCRTNRAVTHPRNELHPQLLPLAKPYAATPLLVVIRSGVIAESVMRLISWPSSQSSSIAIFRPAGIVAFACD